LEGVRQVDGILADLGVSSHQLDIPKRGFSYRYNAPLDMRMNTENTVTAAIILNTYSEEALLRMLSEYGEVRNSRTLAKAIVAARVNQEFRTTADLNLVLERWMLGQKARYFSQVYQAIRIEVNDEMGALKEMLTDGLQMLKEGGRFVVMSYHSIEDRLVKNFFKTGNFEGEVLKDEFGNISRPFRLINKKVIEADEQELKINPRARSAKLRIAEKI
jgi:16S rRNA (cytosine1402-N4)-methyltransferase